MNAAKPTPGPWAVEPAGADGDMDYGRPQRDGSRALLCLHINAPQGGGGRIGRCFANCLVTDEELHANAALFAAGPDLLKELQARAENAEQSAFEEWLAIVRPSGDVEQVQSQWEASSAHEDFYEEWKGSLAAIAKATGVA